MILLISKDWYREFSGDIQEMHLLRHRVFNERLQWDVPAKGGFEIDTYDADCPDYLILKNDRARVVGCVRFLPTTGPTMLRDTFPGLLDGTAVPEDISILESSRFALDLDSGAQKTRNGIAVDTYKLFAGMLEYRRNLLQFLRRRELQSAGANLSKETGLGFTETTDGARFEGVYKRSVKLASGRFAILEKSKDFTLVPWRPAMEHQLGKAVSGRLRGSNISFDITRKRGLGIG